MAVLTLSLLPMLALAAPPEAPSPERAERMERRVRMMRVVGLAETLELEPEQALKLADTMRQFDERRRPLRQQVRESAKVLKQAAAGDASAQSQVDQAVQRAFDARAQMATLDREMYQALAKDLPPQQRAQLALFLARNHGKMKKMAKGMEHEGRRERRHQRMRRMQGAGGEQG
ncbi:MAG TPA: hypothetical protein VLQ93_23955 [Myxococcaceae bacterium]|nr:hypothetical protein [Myxococcaceae bacterium]